MLAWDILSQFMSVNDSMNLGRISLFGEVWLLEMKNIDSIGEEDGSAKYALP